MIEHNPETMLLAVIHHDHELLQLNALKWVKEYVDHNECGLAYDILIGEISRGKYEPSNQSLRLIKKVANELGVIYPNITF